MTATWTAPKTWATGELVTATDMNTYLRDELEFLKDPPTATYVLNEGSDYSTTSTSFVDVDGTNLSLALTTAGGDVMIGFFGLFRSSSTFQVHLDVAVDGARWGGDDGIVAMRVSSNVPDREAGFVVLMQGLSAGAHTFDLQWKVSGGTMTLYAGAGTANADVHAQFWAREVS